MHARLLSVVALAVALFASVAQATSVVPPSFAELVADADAIYRGRVTALQARRVERPDGQGSVIKTFVTLAVERVLKGPAREEITLEFLGGMVGDEQLEVTGMPKFAVGGREFVFVQKNGVQFCPLVALGHGRYRVRHDTASGRDYIERDNGLPLTDPAEVAVPLQQLPTPLRAASAASSLARALSPAAFEASVTAQVQSSATAHRD
jgi:hypothetical protein